MGEFVTPTSYRKARKQHVCHGCGKAIAVGEQYAFISGHSDGFFKLHIHKECNFAMSFYSYDEWEVHHRGDIKKVPTLPYTPKEFEILRRVWSRAEIARQENDLVYYPYDAADEELCLKLTDKGYLKSVFQHNFGFLLTDSSAADMRMLRDHQ